MNLSLLKLLVRYSDDYGCVDLSKVKSLYQGSSSLSSELQKLQALGYITCLCDDDEYDEVAGNGAAYRRVK